MAVIREVEIRNFRGISYLKWCPNPGINCLIGPGDSGKSTILDAIDLCLGSRQNFTFTDADFHFCNFSDPVIIDVTLGELDDALLNLEVYGHFFRGWEGGTCTLYDETSAALETVLTLRLIVRDDLEPQWLLFSPGPAAEDREKNLQWKHRQRIAPVRLGAVAAHHLALGPRSVLGKLSDDVAQAASALASASRQARQTFADQGCEGIETLLSASKRISNDMGIRVDEVKALLDVKGMMLSGSTISLHDQDQVPMKNLGSGSTRLLVTGLQKEVGRSSIFIVDEVEFGLEPYRIVRLLDLLGAKRNDESQQVFLTTHSPVVLRELSSAQLFRVGGQRESLPTAEVGDGVQPAARKIIRNRLNPLGGSLEAQKTLRVCAEAFLAPSVIVCEGKTEIGVIRGLDLCDQDNGRTSILALGCHWADGDGSTMFERAYIFASMGYRTALFMDSDVAYPATEYTRLQEAGISVFRWPDGYSTEQALFFSVAAAQIPTLLDIACQWRSTDSVDHRIRNASSNSYTLASCRESFVDEMRPILARCANDGKWFKDIEPAEIAFRNVVAPNWHQTLPILTSALNGLWRWISPPPPPPPPPPPSHNVFE
ncbi:ATP-dependent nuclease [Thalassospira lucentensis]|uniref:ATP-dependent nuclease n=1 Tax=Thalassospira lucentensis TaxID=168935 RepID=UPI002943542E|nr:AAA family ATPase [Thalassospira lucentensis]WOI10805.1 AAA family ATPase [Thalassospira lucentensis]